MLFSSTEFLFLFLPVVLLLYYNPLWKGRTFRNVCLFVLSIGFYAWGEPVFVFVMLLSIFLNWVAGIQIEKSNPKRKKWIMGSAVVFDLGLLFVFKYLTFVMKNISSAVGNGQWEVKEIALPIGISFFTFQILSYVFDVYYGKTKAQKNIMNLGLYISMFPQLVAGPIVRYEDVAEQLVTRKETWEEFADGVRRFIYGLGKKVILSNQMAIMADRAFELNGADALSVSMAWLGAITYTLQIYFDFSGYSDMAIGLGKMFGFRFPENFRFPYIANSITDFWRRWHISLSSWFRDYVYIPLGGNRVGAAKQIRNMFVVWLFTGIWHGANWTFILWGLMYFVLLMLEKYTPIVKKLGKLSHLYTMVFVIVCWVVFRAETVSAAGNYIAAMFGIGAGAVLDEAFVFFLNNYKVLLAFAVLMCCPWIDYVKKKAKNEMLWEVGRAVLQIAILLISVSYLLRSTYNPFIYFNF